MVFFRTAEMLLFHKYLLGLVFFIVAYLVFIFFSFESLPLNSSIGFIYTPFSDQKAEGNSYSTVRLEGGKIINQYSLGNKRIYPFAGFYIEKPDLRLFSNEQTVIKFEVEADTALRIPVHLHVQIKGYTRKEIDESSLFLEEVVNVNKGKTAVEVPVRKMDVPSWWYSHNNYYEQNEPFRDLLNTSRLAIGNDQFLKAGGSRVVKINSLRLEKDLFYYHWFTFGLVCLFSLGFLSFAVRHYLKTRKKSFYYIPVPNDKLLEKSLDELNMIKLLIGENYSNLALKPIDIARGVGLSESKMRALLREGTEMTFSEYLTFIRMEEAKRLLYSTSLPISEISCMVGFEYPQSFNRIFKKVIGSSPSGFRREKDAFTSESKSC